MLTVLTDNIIVQNGGKFLEGSLPLVAEVLMQACLLSTLAIGGRGLEPEVSNNEYKAHVHIHTKFCRRNGLA